MGCYIKFPRANRQEKEAVNSIIMLFIKRIYIQYKASPGQQQDAMETLCATWQVLRGIQDRAGWIGVVGRDPPKIRGKSLMCLPRERQQPVPGTSTPGVC